jgi:hypothetical protein
MTFSRFMSQPIGRIIRAVLGLVLIALAFFVMGGTVGTVVGIVVAIIGIVVGTIGLVLIAAGTFNFCVVAPFVGGYFDGRKNLEARPPTTVRGHRGAPQH